MRFAMELELKASSGPLLVGNNMLAITLVLLCVIVEVVVWRIASVEGPQ